jgi:signal transduction histidine kinase
MSSPRSHTNDEGEVVYRRTPLSGAENARESTNGRSVRASRLAPGLITLIVGFVVLLVLVVVLGLLSVRRLESTISEVNDLRDQHVAQLRYLLQLQVATAKLYNEARARSRMKNEPAEVVRPIFDIPLTNTRKNVEELLPTLDKPPLATTPEWQALKRDLASFVVYTEDAGAFSTKGFTAFRDMDEDFDKAQRFLEQRRKQMIDESETLQREAARTIKLLTLAAFALGAFVVIASLREVQRRFKQTKESEDAARRERKFSTQMLEGMVSAVAAVDSRDRIRSANQAFFELFPQAQVGQSVFEKFAPPDSLAMLEAAIARRVDRATYFGRWSVAVGSQIDRKSYDVYASPLAVDDEEGQVITLVDVTEVAEAETAVRRTESLAAVGQAAAQLAHEIRNPLGSIRLGVSMLRDSTGDSDSLQTIDLVERGINHLNKLVMDVTQFSREKPLSLGPVDLSPLLDSSLDLVLDRIRDKRTPVARNYAKEEITGDWDDDQLRQVFVNLIGNAIDASEKGSPVEVSTMLVEKERSLLKGSNGKQDASGMLVARIRITDHGSGMTAETRRRVFEPFFTTKRRGTGLGLAVVKRIVEQHGGKIAVESEARKGTTFTIDLPIKPAGALEQQAVARVSA